MKKALTLLLAGCLLLSLCACGSAVQESASEQEAVPEQETAGEAVAYSIKYSVKINPEFTVYADGDLRVVEIVGENEDAEAVLACVDVLGLSVNDAFGIITEEAKAQGFMTREKGNTPEITILEKDDAQLPTCQVCGGGGTVVCKDCHGTGLACMCERCGGTGEDPSKNTVDSWECWLCHGTGVCPECGGSGQIVVTNGEDGGIVYAAPGVPEMGMCSICWGTGGCDNCHGSSVPKGDAEEVDLTCDGCGGTGYLHCNDDLNGYNWCPCCWGSGVEGTGDPDYQSYYTPSAQYGVEEWKAMLKN